MKKLGLGLGMVRAKRSSVTPPANTVAPVASGTARVGETLSVTDGTWTGTAPITYTYQWRRDGVNIGSATNSTYVLVTADLGTAIDCNVTATNAAGAVTQDSNNITVGSDLSAVLASAVFDLDATKSASYPGSGTTWSNLVTAPADGSAQTDYDFLFGDGSTSTSYPTFTGSAGDAAAYLLFDGADFLKLLSGTNPTFLADLHKTAGSAFWIAATGRHASTASAGLFSTKNGNVPGIDVLPLNSANTRFSYRQRGASEAGLYPTTQEAAGADYIVIWTHDPATNKSRIYYDVATAAETAHTFVDTTSAATLAHIGALGSTGATPSLALPSGWRIYSMAMGNEYLDNTKAAAIIAVLEARHARDYTP